MKKCGPHGLTRLGNRDKPIEVRDRTFLFLCALIQGVLQHIGLDIRGGVLRLENIMYGCVCKKTMFPTTSILVIDAAIAEQWLDLGYHIEDPKLLQQGPQTLGEAAKLYAKCDELIPDLTANATGPKVTEAMIADQLGSGKFSDLLWDFEREKFRLHVRRKLRDAMINKAIGERVSVCSLRNSETYRIGDDGGDR
jgi:hypothetical protein